MKQYTARYLPVEGEIREQSIIYYSPSGNALNPPKEGVYKVTKTSLNTISFDNGTVDRKLCKKVKLFLTTNDIQVGDKVLDEEFCDWIVVESDLKNTKALTKVIGEISDKAIWVKDGNKIDEKDVSIIGKHRSFPDMDIFADNIKEYYEQIKGVEEKYTLIFKVRCPTCNTFH